MDIQTERLKALASTFARADRILAGRDIDVVLVSNSTPAPAWSDGRVITFNTAQLNAPVSTVEGIVALTGVNYHELAHILYTPRPAQVGGAYAEFRGMGTWHYFNILEDQRIETMLTGLFPSTAPYFVSIFTRYCLKDLHTQSKTAFVLAHGRTFLPAAIRRMLERTFMDQASLDAFKAVIDEYRFLSLPAQMDRAVELVKEFSALMSSIAPPSDAYGHSNDQNKGRPEEVNKGRPMSDKAQRNAADAAQWAEEAAAEAAKEAKDEPARGGQQQDDKQDDKQGDSKQNGKPDSKPGDKQDSEEGDGDDAGVPGDPGVEDDSDAGSGDSGSGDVDAGDQSEGDTAPGYRGSDPDMDDGACVGEDDTPANDTPGSGTSLTGGNDPGVPPMDAIRKMMEEAVKQSESIDDVQDDVRQKQQSMRNLGPSNNLPPLKFRLTPVEPTMVAGMRTIARQLAQLAQIHDPGWHTHQASGRINMQRVIRGGDLETIHDQWDEGVNDATDIEVVFCCDISGSMANEMYTLSQSLWMMKAAFESIGVTSTVLAYNSVGWSMYEHGAKTNKTAFRLFKHDGGTDPTAVLQDARRIFGLSKRKHKLLVLMTDGGWYDTRPDRITQQLNTAGVITTMYYLDGYIPTFLKPADTARWRKEQAHSCQHFYPIMSALDMVPTTTKLVKAIIKEAR